MSSTFVSHNNIISSLGCNSQSVVRQVKKETTGLSLVTDERIHPKPFYTSIIPSEKLTESFKEIGVIDQYTKLEQMLILSLKDVIDASAIELDDRVGIIVSTTKGNIDVLEKNSPFPKERAYLSSLGDAVKNFFGLSTEPIVLSNACVSGVLAVATAKRFIAQGRFDHVFITSGDLVTQFIVSGFNSFQALSDLPCKPYCKYRTGINIGEVAASVLVTSKKTGLTPEAVEIIGDASCNDANHISGPSRTGEGLVRAVENAIQEATIETEDIDFISAHGTATLYNDEMEAIAFNRLRMLHTPLHSLKGYFGHTLGASGLLETIVGMHSLHQNTLFASLGYTERGVSKPLNIIEKTTPKQLSTFLKTASGFGGCNTAVIFKKANKNHK
ncbi:beta-ketoacyl-[acyl-carrier-protein] synthase family protein [Marinirhabdus gelatinilytica]|uniref:3-oxoacyl-[acyl-carrier-protein] synthase-1 n=1 Tax=Marinirhabdus gelatinilytica TaxID=1703343 RepID=A0A370QL18_9FLAO|nr:beta-ketoacyl synthase N-terminal-like domain-containing protein [Marinirhabdus gelatinilytica]RDK88740.1 3-oxoacyl-[acyl-carrier-protein] synthase-1 [Marinirhabdus gelatinilytica]